MPPLKNIHSLDDFQHIARNRLPRQLFSYLCNGAEDEVSMRNNRAAFDRHAFVPRVLEGVAQRAQQIEPRWPPKLPHVWPLKLLHLAGVN